MLAGIVSIFKPIAKQYAGDIFEPTDFCQLVDDLYGLKIHPWAVQDLISRLVSHGILVEHKVVSGIKQYIYAEIEQEFTEITQVDIENVVERFIEYSESKTGRLGIDIDKDTLCERFLTHMSDLNFIAAALRPEDYVKKRSDASTLTTNKEKAAWKSSVQKETRMNILCAGFVIDAFNKDKKLYELIVKIVSGALVSEVVLNFQEPAKNVNLNKVKVILDTPFLMALLNLTSEKEFDFAEEQCKQFVARDANLAVYEHSVDELKDNLYAVLQSYDAGNAFGATGRRLREKPFNQYLRQVLKDPEGVLKKRNIRILKNLTSDSSYMVFSKENEEALYSAFGYYNNSKAQERDALSIALTMRYRNGFKVDLKEFYNCHHIFLTENSFIPDKSKAFMEKNNILSDNNFPPAVSGRYLSGLFWVLFGAKGKDLSKQLLLANCAAALEPKNDLINKMHQFLSKTDPVQAEMFETLMGEERAGQYLMQSSLGDSTLLTQDNAVEVLQELQNSLTEKVELHAEEKIKALEYKSKEELNRARVQYEKNISKQRVVQDELSQQVLDIDSQLMSKRTQIGELNKEMKNLKAEAKEKDKNLLLDFVGKVELLMEDSLKVQRRFKNILAFGVLIIGLMLNLYSINVEDVTSRNFISVGITLVSFLGFWFIPELVFSRLLTWRRDRYFNDLLTLKDLEINFNDFHIDWKNVKLNTKLEG